MSSYHISTPIADKKYTHRHPNNGHDTVQHSRYLTMSEQMNICHQMLDTINQTIITTNELIGQIGHRDIYSALSDESHPFWGDAFPLEMEHPITGIIMVVYLQIDYITLMRQYQHMSNDLHHGRSLRMISSQLGPLMRDIEQLASVSHFYTDQQQRLSLFQDIRRKWHNPVFRDFIRHMFENIANQ